MNCWMILLRRGRKLTPICRLWMMKIPSFRDYFSRAESIPLPCSSPIAINVTFLYLLLERNSVMDEIGSSPIINKIGCSGLLSLSQSGTLTSSYSKMFPYPLLLAKNSTVLANCLGIVTDVKMRKSVRVNFSLNLCQESRSLRTFFM